MTKENEQWAAGANMFVSQEEDDTQMYSVRITIFELLSCPLANPSFKRRLHYTLISNVLLPRPTGLKKLAMRGGSGPYGHFCCLVPPGRGHRISNDEHDVGFPRPIDIEYLLAHLILSLALSRF